MQRFKLHSYLISDPAICLTAGDRIDRRFGETGYSPNAIREWHHGMDAQNISWALQIGNASMRNMRACLCNIRQRLAWTCTPTVTPLQTDATLIVSNIHRTTHIAQILVYPGRPLSSKIAPHVESESQSAGGASSPPPLPPPRAPLRRNSSASTENPVSPPKAPTCRGRRTERHPQVKGRKKSAQRQPSEAFAE